MKPKIEHLKKEIDFTTELLYQQRNQEGLERLEKLLEGIMNLMLEIEQKKSQGEEFCFEQESFLSSLKEALDVMEQGDYVTLADILNYDILEKIEGLERNI